MATSRVLERREVQEPTRAATANLHSSLHKYSLLIIIGRTAHFGQTGHISREIQQGIRSWDIDFKSCNLNLCLQEFLSHHTASFKGAGQKCLRHGTRVLDTQVLISPSLQQVHSEVLALLSSESAHKLLILAGQSVEESGDLLFHNGRFSPHQLKQILTEQIGVSKKKHIEMDNIDLVHPASIGGYAKSVLLCNPLPLTLPALESLDQAGSASCPKLSLTLSCPGIGQWKKTLLGSQSLQDSNTLHINPPEVLPAMEALGEFTSLISNTLSTPSPFDLLPPPTTVGFLKLSRPCCYVFPAGRGDCAFFAVNGFTMLIDGGSDSQACFWKLVRHLDRVDAVLLTHVGTENLPGVNTFLERKAAEMDLSSDVKDDSSKRLISPELGVVFFNAPSGLQMEEQPYVDNVLKCTHQAALTVHLLKKLDINPQPLFRPQAVPTKPLTLFQKMGVGQLDLYILSPSKNSQEYQTFMQNWPDAVSSSASKSHTLPLTALTSVSALLVWHPACSQEKVVRVLFPGVTPQAKLLQGLEKLKGLVFLQKPTVTTGDLERHEEDIKTKRTDIQDSGRSQGKETATKPGKDWVGKENGKDIVGEENGKLLNGVTSDKIKIKEIGVKQKAASTERTTSKKGGRNSGKKEKTANREENSGIRRDLGKNDHRHPEPINENKTKHKKEARNYPKTGVKKNRKASGNEAINVKNVNAESLKINSAENSAGTKLKISEPEGLDKELQNQKTKKESEENACNSKTSTSEDAAADWLQQETASKVETADRSGNEESFENLKTEPRTEDGDAIKGNTAGKIVIMGGERGDNEEQHKTLFGEKVGPSQNAPKSAKVVGFPSPLNKTPKTKNSVELDLTPTEFTLLDGALRHTPPSRSSPDYQPPISPGEETVEPDTPDSRPNSAGNTPYCLSPDDVWCNRATLSRLQAQMSNSDPTDVNQPNGASKQSEGQPCQPKTTQESHTNPREKHLSFLPLSTFKDGTSDPSPSVATTTTTHSMPAEVSSPQSTEVDESLSMSLEQGPTTVSQKEGDESGLLLNTNGSHYMGMSAPVRKPPRSLGQTSEMWRPPAPNTFNFEASAHEVDLCLVSPCEFKHFKPTDSSVSEPFAPHEHGDHETKDTSPSESNPPICMEDCTSTTADAALDSDEDESCSDPSNSPRDLCTSQALPKDPPPVQVRDSPPLAPHPGTSMPVPHSDSDDNRKRAKPVETRGKTSKAVTEAPHRSGSAKNRTGSQSGVTKGNVFCTRPPSSNARSAQAKSSPNAGFKPSSAGEVSVYVDLAYIPSGAASPTVNMDFFKSIHSSCYIVSGDSLEREELLRQTLDALLESKRSWPETMQVSVIPTFESVPMQEWYQQTLDRQKELGITVLGSNSTVAMQDETFPACKIEF